MAGKGDSPRPVNGKKFRDNYDNIFRNNTANKFFEEPIPTFDSEPFKEALPSKCPECGGDYTVKPYLLDGDGSLIILCQNCVWGNILTKNELDARLGP